MMKKDDRLIENICQVLDQSLDDLDAVTQSRLNQARHLAMERQQRRRFQFLYWSSVPAAGLVLLLLLLNWPTASLNPTTAPEISELHIITAAEPLEFYQEEIEFYEWLSEVLETEKKLSEYTDTQSVSAVPEPGFGTGKQCARTAGSGAARLSGLI